MSSMSVRRRSRAVAWLTLVALLSGFFVLSGFDSQKAYASGQSITVTPAGQPIANQEVSLGVTVNGTFSAPEYQATVFISSDGTEVTNGNLTIAADKRSGLVALTGRSASSGASLGFSGAKDTVIAALESVSWTPASQQTGISVQVSLLPKLPAGVFYNDVNGRYYEYVAQASVSWSNARIGASAKRLFPTEAADSGLRGYLVHINSEQENQFIANNTTALDIWIGGTDQDVEGSWAWQGLNPSVTGETIGQQAAGTTFSGTDEINFVFDLYSNNDTTNTVSSGGAAAAGYRDWKINGVAMNGRAAWATNEPNNSNGEHCAVTNWSNSKGRWNDLPCSSSTPKGYLVEYGGRSEDPTNLVLGSVSGTAAVTAIAAPAAPTINSITAGNRSLTVAVTPGSNGGSAVTNFQYSTDGGANFVAFDPQVTSGPLTITTQSTAGRPALVNNTAYSVRIKAVNVAGASLQSGATNATPVASKPAAPVITSVTAGNQSLAVAFSISDNGGEDVTGVEYQLNGGSFTAFASTTSPATITGLTNGTSYTVVIRATNSVGTSDNSASATGTPVQPPAPAPTVVTPLATTPINGNTNGLLGGRIAPPTTQTTPLSGPLPSVNGNGQIPSAPNGSIGGRPSTVTTNVVGGNQMTMQTGSSTFGVAVPTGQGQVNSGQNGDRELAVQAGAATRLTGSGLLPGSTVQVFMPLGGNGSRELSQLRVGPTGTFDGDAVFATRPTDPPLPIGRNVMQIASVNNAGERVIVEMAINIAQPSPQPGILRSTGDTPTLTPGQSLATKAGEPADVVLTVNEQLGTTTIQGDGWGFALDTSGASNQVSETQDGGALLNFVRGGDATVSGNGFMPLTRADIWLFSDPTLLGSVDIDADGRFTGSVTVDGRVIPVGDHTLQIQGVGEDGFIVTANLGVVVSDEAPLASPAGTTQASASLLWWVFAAFLLVVAAAVVGWRVTTRRRPGR